MNEVQLQPLSTGVCFLQFYGHSMARKVQLSPRTVLKVGQPSLHPRVVFIVCCPFSVLLTLRWNVPCHSQPFMALSDRGPGNEGDLLWSCAPDRGTQWQMGAGGIIALSEETVQTVVPLLFIPLPRQQ